MPVTFERGAEKVALLFDAMCKVADGAHPDDIVAAASAVAQFVASGTLKQNGASEQQCAEYSIMLCQSFFSGLMNNCQAEPDRGKRETFDLRDFLKGSMQ